MKISKKIVITMISLIVIFTVASYANFENSQTCRINKSKEFEKWEKLSDEERKNVIEPMYTAIDTKETIKRSTYNNLFNNLGTSTYGKKYDLRDFREPINKIKVKNQKKTGSCWAFSYSSMVETTLFNKEKNLYKEFSPMHVDYKTAKMYNRRVGDSGTMFMEMAYSADRYGPIYEEELPFESVYNEKENKQNNYFLSDVDKVSTDQDSEVKIQDISFIAMINKEFDKTEVKYYSGNTKITKQEMNTIRELIKKHIKENGAITTQFFSDIAVTENNEYISQGNFYNNQTNAYYCNDSSKSANHALTIVGWDDEYKKENFAEGNQPLNDGAYIVLNSYGEEFGESGYFYVSYDDVCIEQLMVGIKSISTYDENNKKADYIYQYDELGLNQDIFLNNSTAYSANVFTRKSDEVEYINEVGIWLDVTEGIEVYISKDGELSNYGNPVASYTGSNALESGYHTIKLSSPIKLEKNKFAVIVKYINTENVAIPIECNLKDSEFSSENTLYDKASSNSKESYVSEDGNEWKDIYDLKLNTTNKTYTLRNTNACIKAFTTLIEDGQSQGTNISVTGVKLNKYSETIEVGDELNLVATIEPSNATNKDVKWSSSNNDIATITEEGIIRAVAEGKATITVTTDDGHYTANCEITVTKKTNKDDDIYKEESKKDDSLVKNNTNGDSTISNKILPFAGTKFVIISIIMILGLGSIFYIKYKKYKDVK